MTVDTTRPSSAMRAALAYTLTEAQRQKILSESDSARHRRLVDAQRENFKSLNNGFEFGQPDAAGAE